MIEIPLATDMTGQPSDYIQHDEWRVEQKLDGHRIIVAWNVTPGHLRVTERHGRISQHQQRLQDNHVWLEQGGFHNNFELLGRKRTFVFDGELLGDVYWVFDLVQVDGLVDNTTPLEARRSVLETLFESTNFNSRLQLVPSMVETEDKIDLITRCIVENAEGVIYKDRLSLWTPGRTTAWRKQKFTKNADLIVTGLGYEGKNNAVLSCYRDGELVEVGRCSLNGKPEVSIGDVVEVKYLYLGANDRLVQPTLKFVRDDKTPAECNFLQLERTNKAAILPS